MATKREKLEATLLSKGYRFATEAEYDAFFISRIVNEKNQATKDALIEGVVETKKELGLGLDHFIVPTWFRMIGA